MTILKQDKSVILLDITSESQVDEELRGARELASQNVDCDVVIQFPPVSNLSTLAIVELMKLHKSLTLANRRLILFTANSETKKLFKLAALDTLFEMATDYHTALSKLQETSRNLN